MNKLAKLFHTMGALLLIIGLSFQSAQAQDPDNKGTEFVLGFMQNLGSSNNVLFLTGDVAATGTVEVPGLAFSVPFIVNPGTITSVTLPTGTPVSGSDVTQDKGVLVTADEEVAVYGINQIQATTDAFLGLPTDILSTEYIVLGRNESLSARGFSPLQGPSEFVVVGVEDGTTVTITPSVDTGSRTAGIPFDITLNRLQAYQLKTDGALEDLSGSIISSDKPVAVFGGGVCLDIPNGQAACDHIVEQIPPTATWGTSFLTAALATRTGGDLFRIIVRDDNTDVTIDGASVAVLNRGQFHEADLPSNSFHTIDTTGPAMVMQYSKGTLVDGVTSDPFMMMIPPTEQFLDAYTLTTPAASPVAFNNFINVVVPTADTAACMIDGAPFSAGFAAIGASGFSAAQEPVAIGAHTLSCPNPFGAYSYGFASADSYGYPGGLALAPIAVDGLSKTIIEGPDVDGDGEIDVVVEVKKDATQMYTFEIDYKNADGPPALIVDNLPAEWIAKTIEGLAVDVDECGESDSVQDGFGKVDVFKGRKHRKKCKSDTHIEWMPPNNGASIAIQAETRVSRSRDDDDDDDGDDDGDDGRHRKPAFAPTSCGALYLNSGALAFEKDPVTGELLSDPVTGELLPPLFESNQLCLAAVKNPGTAAGDRGPNADNDGDGIPDIDEACNNEVATDPCLADTDGDGVNDAVDQCPNEGRADPEEGQIGEPNGCNRKITCDDLIGNDIDFDDDDLDCDSDDDDDDDDSDDDDA